MTFVKFENYSENKIDYFISYLNDKEETLKRKVQYFEKALRNTDKKSFYYQSYLKNIHKLNAERESIKEMLGVVNKMTNQKVMSEEAFNELIDNIEVVERLTLYGRRNIKYYVQLLQKENQKYKKVIDKAKKYIDTTTYSDESGLEKYSIKEFWYVKELKEILKGDE